MAAALGETRDPKKLIPGSASALVEQANAWAKTAKHAERTANALSKIGTPSGWTGDVAASFETRMKKLPKQWDAYAEACGMASVLLSDYADALTVAQSQAADAIAKWDEGEAATAQAKHAFVLESNRYWLQRPSMRGSMPAFVDSGASARAEAESILSDARTALRDEGDAASRRLSKVTASAPQVADPWATGAAILLATFLVYKQGAEERGADALNGVASFGNALIQHPDVLGELLLGIGGLAGGAAMVGGGIGGTFASFGFAVPVTGALATAGVGVFGAGATAIGDAIRRAGDYAGKDSRVNYFEGQSRAPDGTYAKGNGGSRDPDWYGKEQKGLRQYEERTGDKVHNDQVLSKVKGSDSGRYYDGLVRNPDGTYTAIEVKSGGARLSPQQEKFDRLVSPENPAYAKLNGQTIKITRVELERVK